MKFAGIIAEYDPCLLYTSDAADDMQCVDLGGRRIIKKNFFKQKTAYEISECLVGSEMCIRDSIRDDPENQERSSPLEAMTFLYQ